MVKIEVFLEIGRKNKVEENMKMEEKVIMEEEELWQAPEEIFVR